MPSMPRIYSEWVPNNPKYALAAGFNIEVYSMGDTSSETYEVRFGYLLKKNKSAKCEQSMTRINVIGDLQ